MGLNFRIKIDNNIKISKYIPKLLGGIEWKNIKEQVNYEPQ